MAQGCGGLMMKVSELETKLNNLATPFKFEIKESHKEDENVEFNGDFIKLEQVYQGEIIVYLVNENNKESILKIMPPHDDIDQWYVNTESSACLFGVDNLKLYIAILKIAAAFLHEKSVED